MTEMLHRRLHAFEVVRLDIRVGHHKFHILLGFVNHLHDEEILLIDQKHISVGHQQMFR